VAGAVIVTVTVVWVQATCRSFTALGRDDMQPADRRTVKMSLIMIVAYGMMEKEYRF